MRPDLHDANGSARHPQEFVVKIPDAVLDDLRERLARTRWMDEIGDGGWEHGLSVPYLRELVDYWQHQFDWRAEEAAINRFAHFRTEIDGRNVHFIHERGRGPSPFPIILTHGFPDSFLRFAKIIPMLTDPERHGGDPADAFDVVVPSLPGYGFSDAATKDGMLFHVGDLWHRLMAQELGFERFAAHGGDWGSTITEIMARDHADSVVGIHLTDVPFYHAFQKPSDSSKKEEKYLEAIATFGQNQGAYAFIQGAQPQALALGLNDSPSGLAAWLVEKFRRWSDCGGDVETCFTRNELLANIMIYWATGTINSSFAPYYDISQAGAGTWIKEKLKQWKGSSDVPAAFAMFPKDLSHPPREWAERFFNVQRWTEMPRGGHFAPLEAPELLVNDIREFFRPLRAAHDATNRAEEGRPRRRAVGSI
ncbi:MAG TPA: epoxide hydrolase [Gemmatimonadaceae bacterium]|nr:epoxide hydrolase [Gemmatimonadaceae bacterium]